jgi:PAS domain S-box-containing protein
MADRGTRGSDICSSSSVGVPALRPKRVDESGAHGFVRPGRVLPVVAVLFALFRGDLPAQQGAPAAAPVLESVTLQLKWRHQFQFAGYYAAVEQGLYREAGLDVRLVEARPETDYIDEVVSGRAQYGVGRSRLLLARADGLPVVMLAVIFQHSAEILIARKDAGISTPQDAAGHALLLDPRGSDTVRAMLLREGVSREKFRELPHDQELKALLNGKADAASALITDAPFLLERSGLPFVIVNPIRYGVDFYGDCLFTSEQELTSHPDRVRRFRVASLKGWDYAMRHPGEVIGLIERKYPSVLGHDQLVYEAEAMKSLLLPDLVELGHMNPGRWKHMADTFTELGLLRPDFSLEGFLYDPGPRPAPAWFLWIMRASLAALLLFGIGAISLWIHSRRLQRAVEARTSDLSNVNQQLERRNRELSLLNTVMAATDTDPTSLLEIVCRELAHVFGLPQASAAILDADKTTATVVAEYVESGRPSLLHETVTLADVPLARFLTEQQRPLAIDDARVDPRFEVLREFVTRRSAVSVLMLPLVIEDGVIGCVMLSSTGPRRFADDEISLAGSVAGQVAGALSRARLSETRRLMTAIEQTPESVMITDVQGRILYVNPSFEKITGYRRDEVVGRSPGLLKSNRHDAAFYRDLWARITAGQVWRGRLINKKKDGNLFTEDAIIAPVRDEHGNIENFIAVKSDITKELGLQEQYLQAQKMESIGRLAGGVAHDYNNILTAIMGHAQLALMNLPSDHPVREDLEDVLSSAERAVSLTRQLLAFARRQLIEPKVVNLNDLIVQIGKMLHRLIGEDIELVTRTAPNLGHVKADPGQIEQVILNLVVNARDAMPDGGTVTIRTANVTVGDVDARRYVGFTPGDYILLTVSDTGAGMSEEVKNHLFEPFFTTKEQGKGTGLGLATCYGIIEQSQGHIHFVSELGRGTTFSVYLPRVMDQVESLDDSVSLSALPRGAETILVAEDEAATRSLFARVLRRQGYQVLEAANGREALSLIEAGGANIRLLLADVVMPAMGGKMLADRLRSIYPESKVLFMSGYVSGEGIQPDLNRPGTSFIQKPFTPSVLVRVVREMIDAR